MKNYGTVYGSPEQAKPLVIGKDTVYVHSDIKKMDTEDGLELFSYTEVQYGKDEYIELMAKKNQALKEQVEATQEAVDFLLLNNGI